MATYIWANIGSGMACCLSAPSHCLNQCWVLISGVLCHAKSKFTAIAHEAILYNKFEIYSFKMTAISIEIPNYIDKTVSQPSYLKMGIPIPILGKIISTYISIYIYSNGPLTFPSRVPQGKASVTGVNYLIDPQRLWILTVNSLI